MMGIDLHRFFNIGLSNRNDRNRDDHIILKLYILIFLVDLLYCTYRMVYGYESKPWCPNGTLGHSWLMDGFDQFPYKSARTEGAEAW